MARSSTVRLSCDHKVHWPDRCVFCRGPRPQERLTFSSRTTGWWTPLYWVGGVRRSTEAPACAECRGDLVLQRRLRVAGTFLAGALGVAGAAWILQHMEGTTARVLAVAMAMLCMGSFLLWDYFFAPSFELEAWKDHLDFRFSDADLASEFAELNGVEVLEAGREVPATG